MDIVPYKNAASIMKQLPSIEDQYDYSEKLKALKGYAKDPDFFVAELEAQVAMAETLPKAMENGDVKAERNGKGQPRYLLSQGDNIEIHNQTVNLWRQVAAIPEHERQRFYAQTKKPTRAALIRWFAGEKTFTSVIQPDDSWTFNPPKYGRIDGETGHGYIPGDLYANVFWYWMIEGGLFVDMMAGSGMAWHVYDRRTEWMNGGYFDFDVRMYDLNPRGPYAEKITKRDATKWVAKADLAFFDLPYFGMVKNQYSDKASDLANMDLDDWMQAVDRIAANCRDKCDRVVIVTPQYADRDNVLLVPIPNLVANIFWDNGFCVYEKAYSSRAIQKTQNPRQAMLNNEAKKTKLMLTDMSEVICFEQR